MKKGIVLAVILVLVFSLGCFAFQNELSLGDLDYLAPLQINQAPNVLGRVFLVSIVVFVIVLCVWGMTHLPW